MQITATSNAKKVDVEQRSDPLALVSDVGLMIRVDPDFDPLRHQISAKKAQAHP